MKKRVFIIVFVLLFLGFLSSFVSAQFYGYGVEGMIQSVVDNIEPVLRALLGGDSWDDYLLFEKTLLFILVTIISYLALSNVPMFRDGNKALLRFIALIVGLLGVRNLDYLWLNTVFLQYGILFVAIASVIPFMIFWFFLEGFGDRPILRRIAWIFYAVIYFGLWITTDVENHGFVFLITALVVLAYVLIFDGMVHRWMDMQQIKRGDKNAKRRRIAELKKDISEIEGLVRMGHMSERDGESEIRRLKGLIKSMHRY